jgi:hypothetical protein
VNGEHKTPVESRTEEHVAKVISTAKGVQAVCSCGWKGVDRCRMSDDYAFTNAGEEGRDHMKKSGVAAQKSKRDERSGADRCWIWRDSAHYPQVALSRPDPRLYPTAVEYMRVMSRQEVEKLANSEGVDVMQMVNSQLRTIEGQRREIRRLNEALRRKASDEAPSFSPNFDERNGIT